MIKITIKLFVFFFLCVMTFAFFAIQDGGDGFRHAGNLADRGMNDLADTADIVRESSINIREAAGEAMGAINHTGEKIKETSSKAIKAVTGARESVIRITGHAEAVSSSADVPSPSSH